MTHWSARRYDGRAWEVAPSTSPDLGEVTLIPGSLLTQAFEGAAKEASGSKCFLNQIARYHTGPFGSNSSYVDYTEDYKTIRVTLNGLWYKRDLTPEESHIALLNDTLRALGRDMILPYTLTIGFHFGDGTWFRMPVSTRTYGGTGGGHKNKPRETARKTNARNLQAAMQAAMAGANA